MSYKRLTTVMKWDVGELCPLLAPAMGFLVSDGSSFDPKVSRGVSLHILPFLTIQGISLMPPSAEAWRAPAAGDIYMSFMALFLAGKHVHHELTEAEKRWPL